MSTDACCICSSLLNTFDQKTEKPIVPDRYLPCCGRVVCTRCITQNRRFKTYCPYCQVSTEPSSLPQGLKDPPAYDADTKPSLASGIAQGQRDASQNDELPPAYSEYASAHPISEKSGMPPQDVLHFVRDTDTVQSLALSYNVPVEVLRRHNQLYTGADHLLQARKLVLIPGAYCKGVQSLSPTPVEDEWEEARKNKIRRWMVACKCADYDVALLYLEQSGYDFEDAVQAYKDDEQWEKDNPQVAKSRGKTALKSPKKVGMRRYLGAAT